MKYIEGRPREQASFLPETIEDYVGEESPVRVIDAFVEALDMSAAGFKRAEKNIMGRPAYDPRDLLKLYIYGYVNGIRSSRKLARECERNVEVFYLIRMLKPDFRTIADFRKDNAGAVKKVFLSFTRLCARMELVGNTAAVDGTKVRASNSKDNCYTAAVLEKKLSTIEAKIERYMHELDEADNGEEETEASPEAVRKALGELRKRKEKYREYLEELEKSGETQLLTTDPEARRMHSKDGFHCCYNVQAAVESKSHIIADYEVTSQGNDMGRLCSTAISAKQQIGAPVLHVMADKGYDSRADMLDCLMNGIVPQVIPKYDKDETVFALEYEENEISGEEKSSSDPRDIQKCLRAGVLPSVYEGSGISVEVKYPGKLSCFTKNEDGTVTCPTGKILRKVRKRGNNTIYGSKEACRECTTRCKSGDKFKTVSFGPDTKYVPVRMYGKTNKGLNPLPDEEPNPYNHTLDRWDYLKPETVIVTIRHDRQTARKRKSVAEHPFGTVKRDIGAYYTLLRGKTRVTADVGLAFLAYNLKRVINIVGVKRLIEEMGR